MNINMTQKSSVFQKPLPKVTSSQAPFKSTVQADVVYFSGIRDRLEKLAEPLKDVAKGPVSQGISKVEELLGLESNASKAFKELQPIPWREYPDNQRPFTAAEMSYFQRELAQIPMNIQHFLQQEGITIDLITDFDLGDYPGAHWGEDVYEKRRQGIPSGIGGFFDPNLKKIVVPARDAYDWTGSGFVHEVGHAFDFALRRRSGASWWFSDKDPAWKALYQQCKTSYVDKIGKDLPSIEAFARGFNDYFQQEVILKDSGRVPFPVEFRDFFKGLIESV